jgi:hypothetical protein
MPNDDFCFEMSVTKGSKGNPLIVINFKDDYKNYWKRNNS